MQRGRHGHPATALLEVAVHVEAEDFDPEDFLLYRAGIPEEEMEMLRFHLLPVGWNDPEPGVAAQMLGDAWLRRGEKLALAVPSALVPAPAFNVLLNPAHPGFLDVEIGEPVALRKAGGLWRGTGGNWREGFPSSAGRTGSSGVLPARRRRNSDTRGTRILLRNRRYSKFARKNGWTEDVTGNVPSKARRGQGRGAARLSRQGHGRSENSI